MGMVVQHNMNALNAYNRLNANVAGLKKASEKLSSGYRINRAGDDAAGLAISEKMRSQIKGLNQATRNAQDGINMIQTFEGAAQETHSILQRMKELATESANGTYDNATDRAAIQLEYDQLNDELNQIADTDYNGTIVLNGGQMADGLQAVGTKVDGVIQNGEFDYKLNFKAQKDAEQAAIDAMDVPEPKDIVASATDTGFKTVGDINYDKDEAANLWEKLDLDDTAVSADVSFRYDGTTFKAVSGVAYKDATKLDTSGVDTALDDTKKGDFLKDITVADDVFTFTEAANTGTGATGKGGFEVTVKGSTKVVADILLDTASLKAGDVITLNFSNPGGKNQAPKNITFTDDSFDGMDGHFKSDTGISIGKAGDLLTALDDTKMNADYEKVLDALQGKQIDFTLIPAATATNTALTPSLTTTQIVAGGVTINVGLANTNKEITFTLASAVGSVVTTSPLLTVNLDAIKQDSNYNPGGTPTAETVSFKLDFSKYSAVNPNAKYDVSYSNTKDEIINGDPSVAAAQQAKKDAQAAFDKKWGGGDSVSKANSFEKSEGRLTYTNNITLQTGARTKDSVNFSFKYNVDDSADMRGLTANLNLSARKDGLNTAGLNLKTAKDANYAIDQIDKAINKTSMVRATFGSIQNRLEHKITNLTTTTENLTEAESSIRDTDMASEMMNYTKFNILQQAAQSMLAQANQQPQSVLQLLG